MFDIKITPEQLNYSIGLNNKHNFGNRGKGDGTKSQQLIGLIGQTVVADLLNLKRPSANEGFDGGYDFLIKGRKIDVKTMGRTVSVKPHYVHNFVGYQKIFDVDYYLFCSFNKATKVLSICGIKAKEEFLKKARFYQKGQLRFRDDGTSFPSKAPLYEIKQYDLDPINNIEDIRKRIV